jgi:hypothetical protein
VTFSGGSAPSHSAIMVERCASITARAGPGKASGSADRRAATGTHALALYQRDQLRQGNREGRFVRRAEQLPPDRADLLPRAPDPTPIGLHLRRATPRIRGSIRGPTKTASKNGGNPGVVPGGRSAPATGSAPLRDGSRVRFAESSGISWPITPAFDIGRARVRLLVAMW